MFNYSISNSNDTEKRNFYFSGDRMLPGHPLHLERGGVRLAHAIFLLLLSCASHAQLPVWPGDANNDGIANHLDILNIGIGFGRQGNPRDSVNALWQQEQVQAWTDTLPNSQNLGYADCSGNGFVNIEDVAAIESNYDSINSNFNGLNFLQGGPDDPALTILLNGAAFQQGEQSSVTVYLDAEANDSVYGIAFTFEYDTTIIKRGTVSAQPHPQFGGGGRQPVYIQKNDTVAALLEFGISRTNARNHGGNLSVCVISFVIEDNLIGKDVFDFANVFRVKKIRLFDRQMNNIPVRGDSADARIMTGIREEQGIPFNIYPVPAADWLFIDNYNNEKPVSVEMIDLKGVVYSLKKVEHHWSMMLDVSDLPRGIYVLKLVMENDVLTRKILIER